MSFDSRIHENFTIRFSISSPLGDSLGKLNKFSCLLDAKQLLALSTPSSNEPLQCAVADDYIEVIQDLIVCPLLEQEFMSTMGPSIGKASDTECHIELMSSSSCFVLARFHCSEVKSFTQCHCLCWS